ncbi:MAG: zf-HC2 domain-containing protein [Nitrospirota bacterium]
MKLSHDEIKELLPDFLKGPLPEEIRQTLEAHVKGCEECREDLSIISEILSVKVPDPGDLFWNTLSAKVRRSVNEERIPRFSMRSFLFRPIPVAAAIMLSFLIIFIFTKKNKTPDMDPFFKDPFSVDVLDYSDVSGEAIQMIAEELIQDKEFVHSSYPDVLAGNSYYRELAFLSAEDMAGLLAELERELKRGG